MTSRLPVGYRFYWDSQCRFCNSAKRLGELLDWRRRVTFLPLDGQAAELELAHLSEEEKWSSSHLVTPNGQVLSRGDGIMGLAEQLPLTAPLVFLFRLLPYHGRLADRAYGWVSSHRGVPYGGSCKVSFAPPEETAHP